MVRASVLGLFLIMFAQWPVNAQTSADSDIVKITAALDTIDTTELAPVSISPDAAVPKNADGSRQAPLTIPGLDVSVPIDPLRPDPLKSVGRPPRTQTALYGSLLTLQLLDAHSTRRALAFGGREANPAMAPVVGNVAALVGVKVGATALTIYLTEKLRKRNPAAAVALMIGLNAFSTAVVTHNYRVPRQ